MSTADRELLEMAVKFHGHKCPAMPLGLRVGLAALEALGVERDKNNELYCQVETGFAHATMCFVDGVQVSTGCTYGKANIEKLGWSKNAVTLIDVRKGKAVRVWPNPEVQKKGLGSEFVKLRAQGVQPQDIAAEIVDPLIERIWMAPTEELVRVGEVFDINFTRAKSTFEWRECEDCGEVVFAPGVRLKDGKLVCLSCAGQGY